MHYRTVNRHRVRALRWTAWAAFVAAAAAGLAGLTATGQPWPVIGGAVGAVAAGLVMMHRWMRDEGGVPVLYYHSINDDPHWLPWPSTIVSVETFERHLRMLRARGLDVIRTAEFLDARRNGRPLPPRPVVIHIDDGYLDTWAAAAPLLRRHRLPATVFVSLDFIEAGDAPRPTLTDAAPCGRTWRGYMNWAELAAMQRGGLIDIQPHGVDHGRVETGPKVVDRLTRRNWRRLIWVQWRRMDGPKAEWVHWREPPLVPLGTPVHANAPALAARAWRPDEGRESREAYEERVREHLWRAKQGLEDRLKAPMRVFCWPENGTNATARRVAAAAGYRATTAGAGENRPDEDPTVISRLGVGDRVVGWRWPAAEAAVLYAAIRVFQGNYYWYGLVAAAAVSRRASAIVRRMGRRPPCL